MSIIEVMIGLIMITITISSFRLTPLQYDPAIYVQAITNFYQQFGRMPYPAQADGIESIALQAGQLPYRTLNLKQCRVEYKLQHVQKPQAICTAIARYVEHQPQVTTCLIADKELTLVMPETIRIPAVKLLRTASGKYCISEHEARASICILHSQSDTSCSATIIHDATSPI